MSEFIVYPAIDLRNGQVVRLQQGDPKRQTIFDNNPAGTARRWLEQGAAWIHVVNLDGAFGEQDSANREALANILEVAGEFGAEVQFGGGLRTLTSIQQALDLGLGRVVLGTAAVKAPEVVAAALTRWGNERIAVGLDARDGKVRIAGWQEQTDLAAIDLARRLSELGLKWLIYTDIARDGLGVGLNIRDTLALARETGLSVIASGGVRHAADVHGIRAAGLPGVIIGRALYDGVFDLKDVL